MAELLPGLNFYLNPDSSAYTSSIQSCANAQGVVFFAIVANPPGGIGTQYCVIIRRDIDGTRKEIRRYHAADNQHNLLARGADPNLTNGKYGNVTIAVSGQDLILGFELRINGINTPVIAVEKGLAV